MKFGLEEELIMWIMKTSITQIWMVCHLLPFAKVGQICHAVIIIVIICFGVVVVLGLKGTIHDTFSSTPALHEIYFAGVDFDIRRILWKLKNQNLSVQK